MLKILRRQVRPGADEADDADSDDDADDAHNDDRITLEDITDKIRQGAYNRVVDTWKMTLLLG